MEGIIKALTEILQPTALILLLIVIWQFKQLKNKDDRIFEIFGLINDNTEVLMKLLGMFQARGGK